MKDLIARLSGGLVFALGAMPQPMMPQHMMPQHLMAQQSTPAVVESGAGSETYVLVSGLVGGTAGYAKLATRLVDQGYRVIAIDPYRLSLDSVDVSFAALARRVDAVLAQRNVWSAHVVGHAHGGGVMLRLAAMSPARVAELCLLDVGALSNSRNKVFSASLRLVPIIVHVPGGRAFVRNRFVKGLRESSGNSNWVDSATQHAYIDPYLQDLERAIAMGARLNRSEEPELVAAVVARLHVPVIVILGMAPHDAAPGAEELQALAPLGARLHIERLAGVGHFPHEEAPDDVARLLQLRARAIVAGRAGGVP